MTGLAWRLIGATLYCIGLAMATQAWQSPTDSDNPVFVRKVPRPPECPDCGVGAKYVNAE